MSIEEYHAYGTPEPPLLPLEVGGRKILKWNGDTLLKNIGRIPSLDLLWTALAPLQLDASASIEVNGGPLTADHPWLHGDSPATAIVYEDALIEDLSCAVCHADFA